MPIYKYYQYVQTIFSGLVVCIRNKAEMTGVWIYISTILILRLDLRDGPGAGHRVAQIHIQLHPHRVLSYLYGMDRDRIRR